MYGDPEALRRCATQLRERGSVVRTVADRLTSEAETSTWPGRAGQALAARVRERADDLRGVAGRHDEAARALEEHLNATEERREAIAAAERRVRALVQAAAERVSRHEELAAQEGHGSAGVADPHDLTLLARQLPPPGHRAWLTLDVPEETA